MVGRRMMIDVFSWGRESGQSGWLCAWLRLEPSLLAYCVIVSLVLLCGREWEAL